MALQTLLATAGLGALVKLTLPAAVYLLARTTASALDLQPKRNEEALWADVRIVAWLRRHDSIFAALSMAMVMLHIRKFRLIGHRSEVVGGLPGLAAHCDTIIPMVSGLIMCVSVCLWVGLPGRVFNKHRSAIMWSSRILRMTGLTLSVMPGLCGEPTIVQKMFQDDNAKANQPMLFTLGRLLFLYSGAFHLLVHNASCPLPSRHSVWLHVAGACVVTFALAPNTAHLAMAGESHTLQASRGLCQAASGCLDVVLMSPWPWHADSCSVHVLEWLLAVVGVTLGCVVPILISAAVEYRAKCSFIRGVEAPPQQQGQQAAPAAVTAITVGSPVAWQRLRYSVVLMQTLAIAFAITIERLMLMGFTSPGEGSVASDQY